MLYIAICDDDELIIAKMRDIIEATLEQANIPISIEQFTNGEEFITQYQIRDDELIFLDIDMPIKSGLDVISELEKFDRNKNIILITNHDHLALESLSYAPFQIIRKINMVADIPKAIARYIKVQKQNDSIIEFAGKGKVYHIRKDKITYIEKCSHHIIIHRIGEQDITVRGNIQDCEAELAGGGFVRIHTGYIVNLKHCNYIEKNEIILMDGTKLPISRERKKVTKEQFMINRRC